MSDPQEGAHAGEAEAQREATVMPWVWGALGLLLIALFVAWTVFAPPHALMRHPPHAAPAAAPSLRG